MIDISNKRDLAILSSDWTSDLENFLLEVLDGLNRPWVSVGGARRYFTTRYKKYRYMLLQECKILHLTRDSMHATWAEVVNWRDHFSDYVKADENVMQTLVNRQMNWNALVSREALKSVFVQIFEDFTKKYAYTYFERLNIRTCPYCNRNYTFTVKKKDATTDFATRPELDHFHDKSTYPLLALSFYNLVPSCHECNHGKAEKEVGVNPYFKGIESNLSIANTDDIPRIMDANELRAVKDIADFCIVFDRPSENEKKNIKNLGLAALYNEHKDYVMEIIDKAVTYDRCLEEGLVDSFQGIFHSPLEVHNFVFGKYLAQDEIEKRPLSKLTKDVLEQLGRQ